MKRQGLDDPKSANEFAARTRDLALRAQADFNAAVAREPARVPTVDRARTARRRP